MQETSYLGKKLRKKTFVRFDALTLTKIGEAVRLSRRKQGMTLDQLADYSGISKRTLINLEQGQDVRFSTLTTVLSCLGLALDFSQHTKDVLEEAERRKDTDRTCTDDGEWY